jgi:hypothetical protein
MPVNTHDCMLLLQCKAELLTLLSCTCSSLKPMSSRHAERAGELSEHMEHMKKLNLLDIC